MDTICRSVCVPGQRLHRIPRNPRPPRISTSADPVLRFRCPNHSSFCSTIPRIDINNCLKFPFLANFWTTFGQLSVQFLANLLDSFWTTSDLVYLRFKTGFALDNSSPELSCEDLEITYIDISRTLPPGLRTLSQVRGW
jgi:hypothetical protein